MRRHQYSIRYKGTREKRKAPRISPKQEIKNQIDTGFFISPVYI